MDRYGWTALHYAAVEGQFNVVELLLGAGVDVRQRDKDGATAAYRAHVARHDDVVCLMTSALADNDDLLTLHRDDDDSSRQPPESLYAHVRKLDTTGEFLLMYLLRLTLKKNSILAQYVARCQISVRFTKCL